MSDQSRPQDATKAYSYLRFSTPEQMKGDSFRRQAELAKRYAATHGLQLDDKLTFHDLGVSAYRGANVEVGQLGAFLEAVRTGIVAPGSYLLVESLDRVSRKVARKAVRVLEDIVEFGVTVVTLNDGREYTSESLDGFDFMMAVMILIRANEESLVKSKRLKAAWVGKRHKVNDGQALTALTPGWIRLDAKRRPVLIEERAEIVRRIFAEFLDGKGKESIVRDLNSEGVPTFGRARHWHRSYVAKILQAPAIVGTFVPHVIEFDEDGKKSRRALEPVEGYFPAVVDSETFERAQSLIASTGTQRGRHSGKAVKSLLAGLARCPLCGSTMTRVVKGQPPKSYPYLVCTKAKAKAGCDYHGVRQDVVESALVDSAVNIVGEMPHSDAGIGEAIAVHEAQLGDLQSRIESLVDQLERRPSDALRDRLEQLEGSARSIRAELDQLEKKAAESESKVVAFKGHALLETLRADPINAQAANTALRAALSGVVVDYRSGYLELHWQHGGISSVAYDVFTPQELSDGAL